MRSIKVIGSVFVAVLLMASSASAANFDPPNTIVHGHGSLTLRSPATGTGATIVCTVTTNIISSGNDHGTTVNAAGADAGPTFSDCTNNLGLADTTVTSGPAWTFTATSTTSVDVTGNGTISIAGGACHIAIASASVPNNAWSNSTHTLTANSGQSFPIVRSGFCPLTDSSASMAGSVVFAGDSTIT